jgi:hypothetical protein
MSLSRSFLTLTKWILCLATVVVMLYLYIDKQNELINLRIQVRALTKELKSIQENNISLQYEVDRFESPVHLMELAKKPMFSHLKYPYIKDIMILQHPPVSDKTDGPP